MSFSDQHSKKHKTIGTHNGTFHLDDVLACVMLKHYTNEFVGATIYRSKDPEFLNSLDLLVDVGGVYDPRKHRYDHHQHTFEETFHEESDIRLSGAGLVYKHFGHEVIENIIHQKLFPHHSYKKDNYYFDLKQMIDKGG